MEKEEEGEDAETQASDGLHKYADDFVACEWGNVTLCASANVISFFLPLTHLACP